MNLKSTHYLSTLFLFIAVNASSQLTIETYIKENVSAIKHLNIDSNNFNDLIPIRQAIGNSRIVLLGEQDHGDAPTFAAKARIIRYLHDSLDFNVLAFESDFFALNYEWTSVKNGQAPIDSFLFNNILNVWTNCYTSKNLFYSYIPGTIRSERPLEITGFDNQLLGKVSSNGNIQKCFYSYLDHIPIPFTHSSDFKNYVFQTLFDSLYTQRIASITTLEKLNNYFMIIKKQLPEDSISIFWKQVLQNLSATMDQGIARRKKEVNCSPRDKQMAQNIKWLYDTKYKGEKLIIWAHNYHVSKNSFNYLDTNSEESCSMGHILSQDTFYKNKMYILGFTSGSGTAGVTVMNEANYIYKIPPPKKNSFEGWIDEKIDYGFIDFKPYIKMNLNEKFNMKGSIRNTHQYQYLDWTNIFDGMFYIKHMYTCEKIK